MRRLAAAPPDLEGLVGEELDRRLLARSTRPVAVACSGGGDSLALLLAASAWARRAGRPLLALNVDHGLQALSPAWTDACAATARRLGHAFQALAWTGDKPPTGLPAAARNARHSLLAEAARRAGARVILMGHTADDGLEARAMRAEGATTPEPRAWAPSPVWPEGRGVFLLRPLLALRRAEIRDWLAARGETWIDDPANDNPASARARARRAIALGEAVLRDARAGASARDLALACVMDAGGGLRVARAVVREQPIEAVTRFVATACLCSAGTDRPPGAARTRALAGRLRGVAAVTATLAGARIEADREAVRFLREPGEAKRGGLASLRLAAGATGVWDGRFEITAECDIEVRASAGLRDGLPPDGLRALPPKARDALPMVGEASPALSRVAGVTSRALPLERLLAACGAVEREPA